MGSDIRTVRIKKVRELPMPHEVEKGCLYIVGRSHSKKSLGWYLGAEKGVLKSLSLTKISDIDDAGDAGRKALSARTPAELRAYTGFADVEEKVDAVVENAVVAGNLNW